MTFKSDRKKNGRKRLCLKRIRGRREVEGGTLLLGNGKNNVTKKVLSYFWCLSSKFEIYVVHFVTK